MNTAISKPEIPERGFRHRADGVRRAHDFPRAEVEAALARYFELGIHGAATGDWRPWSDLFTEDAIYVEHAYGTMQGRAAIYQWTMNATRGEPTNLRFEDQWHVIDNDRCVVYAPNYLAAADGGDRYQFVAMAILYYAGDGQWCYEEDIYNSAEAHRVGTAAGGSGALGPPVS